MPPTDPKPDENPHAKAAAMLRAVASKSLASTPLLEPASDAAKRVWLDGFADEFHRRLPNHRPLIAGLLGIDPGATPRDLDAPASLLWARHDPSIDPERYLISSRDADTSWPLLYDPADDSVAIEWRTLDELTALHALWNLSRDPSRPSNSRVRWKARCEHAARWHVAELQPDNATNTPWAVHVFHELADTEPDPAAASSARIHADTLLHNCQVQQGRPDVFSACVLLDAAESLRTQRP